MKSSRITERVYTRLLEQREVEDLIKEYVRSTIENQSLMSEWELALAYAKGNVLLSESAHARGKLIVESFVSGLDAAVSWIGQKVGGAWENIKSATSDVKDAAGKALMMVFDTMPGGKEAFELIKNFSGETAKNIQTTIKDSITGFAELIKSKKQEILELVLFGVDSIKSQLDELMKKAESKPSIKAFLDACKKHSITDAVKIILGEGRTEVAPVASIVITMILDKSEKVKKDLQDKILSYDFFKSKLGVLFIKLMSLLSSDMSGEDVIVAASGLWNAISGIMKGVEDIADASAELIKSLPKIVKGLVSGNSPIEGTVRIAIGDPKAAITVLKNAIKLIMKVFSKNIEKSGPEILKKIKIDPEGKIGKAVLAGMKALVGSGGGSAAASAIE